MNNTPKTQEPVFYEQSEFVGKILLNNKKKYNALSSKAFEQISDFVDIATKSKVKFLIITSASSNKVWSSGYDIEDLSINAKPQDYFIPIDKTIEKLNNFPGLVISSIDGSVWGAAVDLALSSDLILATDNSTFALTPAKLSLNYSMNGIKRITHKCGINIAKELFFTAKPLSAQRLYNLGIINYLYSKSEIEAKLNELLVDLSQNSFISLKTLKTQINSVNQNLDLLCELKIFEDAINEIILDKDYINKIKTFQEKIVKDKK